MLEHSGVLIPREKSYLFENRLRPLLRRFQCASLDALLARAVGDEDAEVTGAVIELMTTHETSFYRDPPAFVALAAELERLYQAGKTEIAIWSAACSTGEEPYSIAFVVDQFRRRRPRVKINILASDIADETLARAREGAYFSLGSYLPNEYEGRYFTRRERRWVVVDNIRNMVQFEHFNLLDVKRRGRTFDIIFCRNVALYFPDDIRLPFFHDLAGCLKPEGMLIVGSSESMYRATTRYHRARHGDFFYYRRAD